MATLRGDLSTICDWPIKQNRYLGPADAAWSGLVFEKES